MIKQIYCSKLDLIELLETIANFVRDNPKYAVFDIIISEVIDDNNNSYSATIYFTDGD